MERYPEVVQLTLLAVARRLHLGFQVYDEPF